MSDERTRVEVLTRVGCHLCDEAIRTVAEVCAEKGVGWREVDVDADRGGSLLTQYSDLVPVVLVDGVQQAFWRVDRTRLSRALG